MSETSNVSWSSYEQIRSEAEYNTRMKLAEDIQRYISSSTERGLNNHFISGLELAKGVVLGLTKNQDSQDSLNTDTLF